MTNIANTPDPSYVARFWDMAVKGDSEDYAMETLGFIKYGNSDDAQSIALEETISREVIELDEVEKAFYLPDGSLIEVDLLRSVEDSSKWFLESLKSKGWVPFRSGASNPSNPSFEDGLSFVKRDGEYCWLLATSQIDESEVGSCMSMVLQMQRR